MGLPLYQGYQWMILQLFGSISKWFAFPLCLVEEVHHNIKRGLYGGVMLANALHETL
jgi:hypothetical protein